MMALFWIFLGMMFIRLIFGESQSEVDAAIRDQTFWLLGIIAFAVGGLSTRISRVVKQLKNEDFDAEAEDRKEWSAAWRFLFSLLILLAFATVVQGGFRCVSEGSDLTMDCVWQGTLEQLADDLN